MGKVHKKWKYGCRASVVFNQNMRIIPGAVTFKANVFECHTLEDAPKQTRALNRKTLKPLAWTERLKGKTNHKDYADQYPETPVEK